MGEEKKVSIVQLGSKPLSEDELNELNENGRVRSSSRLLKCTKCDFEEEFLTLFVTDDLGHEEEIVPKARWVIQDYHRTTKHPDARSLVFRVRHVSDHPSENRESSIDSEE